MSKYGLIGDPIATSLSPALFNAGYSGELKYDLIEGSDFETSWKRFLDEYDGINVTAPFKEKAFRKADLFTPYCSKIGASNLIVKTPEGLLADNSDFTGIICCVAEAYFPGIVAEFCETYGERAHIKVHQFFRQMAGRIFPQKPQALIVGCGGAGRAAAVAAAELGFDTALMNRTAEKAQGIADELAEYDFIVDPVTDFRPALKECELVIYTLPMKLDAVDDLSIEDFAGENTSSGPAKVILEANYKTPSFAGTVLDRLNAAGCRYVSGRDWLLYQAVTGYLRLTGRQPDRKAMAMAMSE